LLNKALTFFSSSFLWKKIPVALKEKPTHMRTSIFLAAVILLASCNSSEKNDHINVTGHASVKVVPDMVEISLRADNTRPAMKDAVAQTQADVNEILAVCRKYVTDPADIKVSSVSTNKSYDYRNNHDIFVGYSAAQVLEVSLKNISKIEQFTEDLLGTRISRIDNIRYDHTKSDSIMRELSLLALEDARKTAEKMCGKMNVRLGRLAYLSNFEPARNDQHGMSYSDNNYDVNLYNKSFGGRSFKTTAEILQFEDAAYASFAIE
jgi:uncharacterized protein YggE